MFEDDVGVVGDLLMQLIRDGYSACFGNLNLNVAEVEYLGMSYILFLSVQDFLRKEPCQGSVSDNN